MRVNNLVIDRRDFLKSGLQTAAGLTLLTVPFETSGAAEELQTYRGALPILQGATNAESTQFVILCEKNINLHYQILSSDGKSLASERLRRETRKHSDWAIEKMKVDGLSLGLQYELKVFNADNGKMLDHRYFSALNLNKPDLKFATASCINDVYKDARVKMWDQLAKTKPEIVFLIGDTCYSDNSNEGGEAGYWKRYCETRMRISWFRQEQLVPTLAVWDDHDFGDNNATKDFKERWITEFLFDLFWGHEKIEGFQKTFGEGKILELQTQRFIFMDCRSYRWDKDPSRGLHWGRDQQDWLIETLTDSSKPAWLMNGSQFFGGYLGKDAFESSHTQNFQDFLKKLARVESPVIFGSGDVHFSEIMQIEKSLLGYDTFEFTSSSIHSHTFPLHQFRAKNDRRIESTSAKNFCFFNSQSDGKAISLAMQSLNSNLNQKFNFSTIVRRGAS